MESIDLNADIGEAVTPAGQAAEAEILKYVSSVNIACGGHAGNDDTMRRTVRQAKGRSVIIGAHPGYPDPDNFGRKSMSLDNPVLAALIENSITEQIVRLAEIAAQEKAAISYVKPHGALYNDAVKSRAHAELIAKVIAGIDPGLVFMGGPYSEMEKAAARAGLRFVREGFIDRRYTDDGHLQSREFDGAVIKDQSARMAQALMLVRDKSVLTSTGKRLNIDPQSLCLHGDSAGAVDTARQARETIEAAGFQIRAFIYAG